MVAYEQNRIGVVTMHRGITALGERHDVTTASGAGWLHILRARGKADSRGTRVQRVDRSGPRRANETTRNHSHTSGLQSLGNRTSQAAMGCSSSLGQGPWSEHSRFDSREVAPNTSIEVVDFLLHTNNTTCIVVGVTTEVPAYLNFGTRVPHGPRSVVTNRAGRGGSFVLKASA